MRFSRVPPRLFGTCAVGAAMALPAGCKSKTIEFNGDTQAIAAVVHWTVDQDAGIDGGLRESMSTAFQSAIWQSSFFDAHPDELDLDADASALVGLGAHHVLVQVYDSPWIVDSPDAGHWDFSELDAIVHPLLKLGQDPVIQIHKPLWLTVDPSTIGVFADYCANLVRYYNSDSGISLADGGVLKSKGPRIQSWAIWSDPNTPDFDPGQDMNAGSAYGAFYNAAVRAMQSVDRSVSFVGPEFNDCSDNQANAQVSSGTCLPGNFIPQFLASAADGGVDGGMAPLDVLSLHMFSADVAVAFDAGLMEVDNVAFETVPRFARNVVEVRNWLSGAGRSNTAIWVTESQVNSDNPTADAGTSELARDKLSQELPFHADPRGTDAFISAWRPYLFSQLGKAGNQELFQWQYTAGRCPYADAGCSLLDASDTDRQNAEVDYVSGKKYLSYWIDRELALKFPAGSQILTTEVTPPDPNYSDVEVLATRRTEGGLDTVVVMVVNHAVQNPTSDVNGPGALRNVVVDFTQVVDEAGGDPGAWSASKVAIDSLPAPDGPAEAPVSLTSIARSYALPVSLEGYGVAFVTLTRPAGG